MGVAVRQWALVVLVCLGFNGTAMLIATPVHAALIPIDDIIGVFGTPGSGAVTLDTDTNLEWLDLIFSLNRSYNDVSNEFGLGRDFEGWRHATMPEVTTLFSNTGFPVGYTLPITPEFLAIMDLFSVTQDETSPNAIKRTFGFFNDQTGGANQGTARFQSTPNFGEEGAYIGADEENAALVGIGRGHWLVRTDAPPPTTVPTPTTTALLALGLLGAAFSRRRRTH